MSSLGEELFSAEIQKELAIEEEIVVKEESASNFAIKGGRRIVYQSVKRILDILGALFGLIVASPVFLLTSILIKLDSKGPIFFSQQRVGLNGKPFKMYKFRSMVVNAEELKEILQKHNEMDGGPMFKMKEDPRVTKIGRFIRKTSIDELPQLINILRGDMSIVGPRPSLPKEVAKFEPWMLERLEVKPGLTCYWQTSGRSDIGFLDWMKLDVKYVRERSTLVDIKLIFKTFKVFLGDEHAR
ncbi:sugar transferase [Clostridium sp. YIM B02505]|uniref:Sugar transferase n=1 Tax=Clostridium yunnanense TaxID=2800325 RepID=A0ABS1EUN5_9CLOT|nr:sugar transferase [Clostridium yunnanense]MBK1813055.1 sugar transferase [Clostridium yunnanense]